MMQGFGIFICLVLMSVYCHAEIHPVDVKLEQGINGYFSFPLDDRFSIQQFHQENFEFSGQCRMKIARHWIDFEELYQENALFRQLKVGKLIADALKNHEELIETTREKGWGDEVVLIDDAFALMYCGTGQVQSFRADGYHFSMIVDDMILQKTLLSHVYD